MVKLITTPIKKEDLINLSVGDQILISGNIYCGRDAVLPKIVELYKSNKLSEHNVKLEGSVIFHTAVSPAGVGPTSSNKLEIESSIGILSEAGVRIHLGKGSIKEETVEALKDNDSLFAIIPPVTALLEDKTIKREVIAFKELGMEAFWCLEVSEYPAIVASINGKTIY